MKALKPSQKENKRYLLISSGKLSGRNLQKKVEESVLEFVGVLGFSKTSLAWIKVDKKLDGKVVASINREAVNSVRASIVVANVKIQCEKISGTLKGLGVK